MKPDAACCQLSELNHCDAAIELGGTEALVANEFGNEIRACFQRLARASLGELGEEFAALRVACLDEFDRLTLDVGEFFGPALL